jgi:hypothetical protein
MCLSRFCRPPDTPFASRVDEFTCAVGGTPDLLKLTPSEAHQRVENMRGNLTALMHAYSPNTRRRFEVWQPHEVPMSGRQSAIKRFQVTVLGQRRYGPTQGTARRRSEQSCGPTSARKKEWTSQRSARATPNPEPAWAAVYDSLMFVKDSPVAQGTMRKIKKYRTTASWHRHLGEPNRPAKPDNAPDLVQARAFAFSLLQGWLDLKVAEYLRKA